MKIEKIIKKNGKLEIQIQKIQSKNEDLYKKINVLTEYANKLYIQNRELKREVALYKNKDSYAEAKKNTVSQVDMHLMNMLDIKTEYDVLKEACSSNEINSIVVINGERVERSLAEEDMKKLKKKFNKANKKLDLSIGDDIALDRQILEEQVEFYQYLYNEYKKNYLEVSKNYRTVLNSTIKDKEIAKNEINEAGDNADEINLEDELDLMKKSEFEFYLKATEKVLNIAPDESADYKTRTENVIKAFNRKTSIIQSVNEELSFSNEKEHNNNDI